MSATLGLDRIAGRCEFGYAQVQHPRFCQCAQVSAAKSNGIAQANRAPDDIKARVDAAIRRIASTGQPFSANDLRVELDGVPGPVVGGRFNAAMNADLIVPTGRRVPSNLASTHGHGVIEWRAA